MIEYVQPGRYDNIQSWQSELSHSTDGVGGNRKKFWYDVVKASLALLYADEGKMQNSWLGREGEDATLSNLNILDALKDILRPSMANFFTNKTINAFLAHSKRPMWTRNSILAKLPFLLIIDEAAYLFHTNYMHSFMWVLDQPIMKILTEDMHHIKSTSQFFILMLGTHSQISHFAPHYYFPSERYFDGGQHIPSVFLSLSWESALQPLNKAPSFESGAHITTLIQWGRPVWSSYYAGFRPKLVDVQDENKIESACLRTCVKFAVEKLAYNHDKSDEQWRLTIFAILALRIHLDLDFASPSRASQLVTSKMRWLVDVDSRRKHIVTTYGSEPILVEAAAYLMNGYKVLRSAYGTADSPVKHILKELEKQLNLGHVNRGQNGELTARLLCICQISLAL